MTTRKRKPQTILHEFDGHGNHRIVALYDDLTNDTSTWFPVASIAHLGDLFACATADHALPFGVFKVQSIPAQVVG